jgi:hypothetical protein
MAQELVGGILKQRVPIMWTRNVWTAWSSLRNCSESAVTRAQATSFAEATREDVVRRASLAPDFVDADANGSATHCPTRWSALTCSQLCRRRCDTNNPALLPLPRVPLPQREPTTDDLNEAVVEIVGQRQGATSRVVGRHTGTVSVTHATIDMVKPPGALSSPLSA